MSASDPLGTWRCNPFFVLGVATTASRTEVERAGQKLLALLTIGSAAARRYDTPLGPATRDEDSVRKALATLRDPKDRVIHELMAELAPKSRLRQSGRSAEGWTSAGETHDRIGAWPA